MKSQPSKYYLRLEERKIRNPSQRDRRQEERRGMNNKLRAMTVAGTVAAVTVLAGCGVGGTQVPEGYVIASQAAPTGQQEPEEVLFGGNTESEMRAYAREGWRTNANKATTCRMFNTMEGIQQLEDAILAGYHGDPWMEKYWAEYRDVLGQECR